MKLQDIKNAGGFIGDEVTEKSVTWTNREGVEHKFEVLVKRRSYGQIEQTVNADDKARGAITIAESIFGEDGKPVFTYDEAFSLEPTLATTLLRTIGEVNARDHEIAGKN